MRQHVHVKMKSDVQGRLNQLELLVQELLDRLGALEKQVGERPVPEYKEPSQVGVEYQYKCGNSPKFFSQLVCTHKRGHHGDHGDGIYSWED